MPFRRAKLAIFCAVAFAPFLTSASAQSRSESSPVLSCPVVRVRVQQFLDGHYLFRNFDNELSKRSFKKIWESFDPGKYFFLGSDIAQFQHLDTQVDDLISRADCKFLFDIQDVFKKRFKERHDFVMTLLAKPFSFDVAEEMVVDPKKVTWAKETTELNERWRKRIKFQVMGMKEGLSEPEARERLKKRYEQIAKRNLEQDSDDVYNNFLNSFASALDPHSTFFLPADQEDFNIRLQNSLEGIGANLTETNGYITIDALVPGGAAHRDGRLKAGDKIIGVDPGDGSGMQDVIDMELSKAVRLIRGKKGTVVRLLVLRKSETGENERVTLSLTRDVVKFKASEAKSDVAEVGGKKIGVIRLPSFYSDFNCRSRSRDECDGSSSHVLREVKALQAKKVDGIILDLRSNGGGDLQESIRMTGHFIPEGTVVQTVDRKRYTKAFQDNDPSVAYSGPFAVLINKHSASASEIVSGAIQDYGRGLVLGDSHSYGKGTVQVVQELPGTDGRPSDGAMKVTQSKFYRPSGKSNQERGIESDVIIPSMLDIDDFGEKQNDYVLPWDSIKPATDYKPLQNFSGLVPKLATASSARVAKDKEFIELREKMEKFKKEKAKGTVSLQEEKKKEEKTKSSKKSAKNEDKKKEGNKDKKRPVDPDEVVVINKEDFQLREAMNILVDAMDALKGEQNWVSLTKQNTATLRDNHGK